jgi:hypothetical protein
MLFTLGGSMFSFIAMTESLLLSFRCSGGIFSDQARTGNHRLELPERAFAR